MRKQARTSGAAMRLLATATEERVADVSVDRRKKLRANDGSGDDDPDSRGENILNTAE